jgi:hypothetical protein
MVYILARIVDKFFLGSAALAVKEHAQIFEVKLDDPQPELHRKRQGPALPVPPGWGPLGCACHRMTSSL